MSFALITGASKGIGKAIAEELASRKIDLLLIARSEDLLKENAIEIAQKYSVKVNYFAIDLANDNAASLIKDWCTTNDFKVSILVNNAGYGLSGIFDAYSYKDYQAMMQVNMNIIVELVHEFLPILKQAKEAYILNISSSAAYQSVPGLNVYAATKAFVLSFSRGLSYELKNTKVSVTCICPGATDSDFANRANVQGEKAKKLAQQFNMKTSEVATFCINAMYAKKVEAVPGFVNKLNKFFAWIVPNNILEKTAAGIYDL